MPGGTGQTGTVTAPLAWTDPAVPQPAPPSLVVRPDRRKARSWLTFILVINGTLAVLCLLLTMWASSTSIGWWGGGSFAITLSGCVFQMVFHSFFYGRMLGTEVIVEVGPRGIRGHTTRWEVVEVPWSDVASVSGGWNQVTIKTASGPKLTVPTRATDTGEPTVRQAITYFSGGRF